VPRQRLVPVPDGADKTIKIEVLHRSHSRLAQESRKYIATFSSGVEDKCVSGEPSLRVCRHSTQIYSVDRSGPLAFAGCLEGDSQHGLGHLLKLTNDVFSLIRERLSENSNCRQVKVVAWNVSVLFSALCKPSQADSGG